jgi:hypothetical protein
MESTSKKRTVAIFGSTGKTGAKILDNLRQHLGELQLRLLVRSKTKLPDWAINNTSITIIEGNVLHKADVFKTCDTATVIVSVIGHGKKTPLDLQTQATKNYLDWIKFQQQSNSNSAKNFTLISLTGTAVITEHDSPNFLDKISNAFITLVDPSRVADGISHFELLKKHSSMCQIIVFRTTVMLPIFSEKNSYSLLENIDGSINIFNNYTIVSKAICKSILDTSHTNKFLSPVIKLVWLK